MATTPSKPGNPFSVYKQLKRRDIRKIEKEANAKPAPTINATIEGERGEWLVVVTFPGEENVASGHLIGRGFGVYQPREPKEYLRKGGRKVVTMRPMFPNYLFVYVWGAKNHVRRICACTGVNRVLVLSDDIPAVVPWCEIDKIRAEENEKNPMVLRLDEVNGRKRKRSRHNKKAKRKRQQQGEDQPFVVTTHTWGFSKSLGTWDDPHASTAPDAQQQERLDLLHKALGLVA